MLAVCLIIAGMNTAVSAIETNAPVQSGSDYVLVDASQDIALYDRHYGTQTSKELEYTKAYGAASYSYKWCPGDAKAVASSKLSGSSLYDLSAYENGYFNLRVYIPSGIAGSSSNKRIAMRIHMKCDTVGKDGDPIDGHHYLRYDTINLKSYSAGWNDISVKIDSFKNRVRDNGGSHTAADILKAVDYVEIGSTGIISGYADEWSGVTDNLYIDKLWLSTSALSADSDIYMVEDYTSGRTHSWGGADNACYNSSTAGGSFYEVDRKTTLNGASNSVHWDKLNETTTISGSSKTRNALYARMLNASKKAVESKVVDEYNYVNVWVCSNAEANQKLYLKMFFDVNDSFKGTASSGHHYIYNDNNMLNVDWTGWKLVSYPIKNMVIRPNKSDKGGSYEWNNGSIKINKVGFEAVSSDKCDKIDLNIDSIFFSVNACSENLSLVSAGMAKTDDLTSTVAPYDKTAVLTFNSEIDASTASVSAAANGVALSDSEYDVQVIGDKIYVHFHNDLPENSTVTVTVADSLKSVYHSRLASAETVTLNTKAAKVITWNDDNSVTIANNSTTDLSGLTLYDAIYANDGSLDSVTTQDISVPAAESKTFEYTVSAQAKNKVFIWDTNLKPLCVENGR